jgi:hypothetical protein
MYVHIFIILYIYFIHSSVIFVLNEVRKRMDDIRQYSPTHLQIPE